MSAQTDDNRRYGAAGAQAARISTVAALAGAARTPRRRTWLVKASAWLPVPLLLALRLAGRRPRRTLLISASFTVTATAMAAVLNYHATLGHDAMLAGPFAGPPDPMRAGSARCCWP